jgi:hypothetical protein
MRRACARIEELLDGRLRWTDSSHVTPVNSAASRAKAGATATRVVGWSVVVTGLLMAVAVGGFFLWLFPKGIVGWLIGGSLGALALGAGGALVAASRRLRHTAHASETIERERVLAALAARSGGVVTAAEAGRALGTSAEEADAYLTELAKRRPDDFGVDIDAEGALVYRVGRLPRARLRVEPELSSTEADAAEGDARDPSHAGGRTARRP